MTAHFRLSGFSKWRRLPRAFQLRRPARFGGDFVAGLSGVGIGLAVLFGCADDPYRDDAIAALGDEDPNVPEGPLHRPGQPCGLCHRSGGTAHPAFSLAGTVYKFPDGLDTLAHVVVRFIDMSGNRYRTATNCAGNFYVQEVDYQPTWPVWLAMELAGEESSMGTPIFREASCATCHFNPPGVASNGVVYFSSKPMEFPPDGCP